MAKASVWIARICFSIAFCWNVVCALQFVIDPGAYAPGFSLHGVEGEVAVRGLGVAFLMWNATYPMFIWKPEKYKVLGGVVLAQQAIGLIGETAILLGLPVGYTTIAESIQRFITFDATGLIIMCISFIILLKFE